MTRSVEEAASVPVIAEWQVRGKRTATQVLRTAEACEELLRKHRGHVRVTKGDALVGERWCSDGKWYWSFNREFFE